MTVEQPTASAGDVERLARVIRAADSATGVTPANAGEYRSMAHYILRSDWLATLLADVRREERGRAWEQAHAEFCPRGGGTDGPDVCSTHLRPGDRHRVAEGAGERYLQLLERSNPSPRLQAAIDEVRSEARGGESRG